MSRRSFDFDFDQAKRRSEEHAERINKPITEAAAVVCATASSWGGSIDPAVAEAIAKNLAKYFGVPAPAENAEKKSQFEHRIKLENL